MIRCYCENCGLYIIVPNQFEGGKGKCPRCKSTLIIPKPVINSERNVETDGVRFFALTSQTPSSNSIVAITKSDGVSNKYKCKKCGEHFESLHFEGSQEGLCPSCNTNNEAPIHKDISFFRPFTSDYCKPDNEDNPIPDIMDEFLFGNTTISETAFDDIEKLRLNAEQEAMNPKDRKKKMN